jgi:hypothetical protein
MNLVDPVAVAVIVVGHLDALGIPNTVGGSLAASFAGEPRSTVWCCTGGIEIHKARCTSRVSRRSTSG